MLRALAALCLLGAVVCSPTADFDAPGPKTERQIKEYRDYLVNSQNAAHRVNSDLYPNANIWENSNKYQGDMVLNDEQIEILVDSYANGTNARPADIHPSRRWPDRTVVYEFANGHFNANQRNYILYSMRVLEHNTCIRFRQRRTNENTFVSISGFSGCWAHVGFYSGFQTSMNVENSTPAGQGCLNLVVIIHEWLHTIGFFHMQSAHNRYDFVNVHWQNMQSGMQHNFDRYPAHLASNLGLPYEYGSCMHYGPYAFSSNGRTTMDARWVHNSEMGHGRFVSGWDVQRVNRHYGCEAWRSDDIKPIYANGTTPEWVNDPKYTSHDIDDIRHLSI